MKSNQKTRGFTLIELLVVVLIIGILAAVALPQYQKAVEKSRMTEAMTHVNTIKKAISLYVLEHDLPQEQTDMLDGKLNIALLPSSDVDVSGLYFHQTGNATHYCAEGFCYEAECSFGRCYVDAVRYPSNHYEIVAIMNDDQSWSDGFYPCSSIGQQMYNSVKHLGYAEYFC